MDKSKLKVEIYKSHKESLELANNIFDNIISAIESETTDSNTPKMSDRDKADLIDVANVAGRDMLSSINLYFRKIVDALESKSLFTDTPNQELMPEPVEPNATDREPTEEELVKELGEKLMYEGARIWFGLDNK